PNKAACWSPAAPDTGMPSAVTPNRPLDGRTSGSTDIGTPNRSHSSSDHANVRMSNKEVRLAFETSVACRAPAVSFQINQASMVPTATSGPAVTPPSVNSHANFVAEKYGSSTRP